MAARRDMLRTALHEPRLRHGGLPAGSFERGERLLARSLGGERQIAGPGTALVHDDKPGTVGTIYTGWAIRYKLLEDGRRQILNILLPGDIFGFDGVLFERPQHSFQAVTDVSYGTVGGDRLRELLTTQPEIALALLRRLAAERRRLDRLVTSIGRCTAEERIASFILELQARLRQRRIAHGNSFNMPITQQHLGDHLGLTVVHVNRVLRRLRELGLLTFRDRVVIIHDFDALAHLGRFGTELAPAYH